MSTLPTKYFGFNSNDYANLGGRIKSPDICAVAKKNWFLRPVARCRGGG